MVAEFRGRGMVQIGVPTEDGLDEGNALNLDLEYRYSALRGDVGIVWPQHHTRTAEILLIHRCKEQNFGLCRYVQRLS